MKALSVVLACLLSFASCLANAQDKILAVTEEFAPFNYTENGKVVGYSTAIVQELLRRAELPYELSSFPWSRSYKMAQTLPNVLIFTMARTPERESEFQWIGPLAKRKLYLYKLAERKDIKVTRLEDAKHYWISINRDDASEKLLLEKGFVLDKNLDLAPTEGSSFSKLIAGRVDFVTGNDFNIAYLAQKAGVPRDKIERSIALIDQGEYYIAASNSMPAETVKHLRAVYAEMEKSGVVKSMQPTFEE